MDESVSDDVTNIVLKIFRLNGQLLTTGDRLTAPLGLTSARWQVLGAIALSSKPMTMPMIADDMGISRQAVLKQINLLASEGLVRQIANHKHKRSSVWELSADGVDKFAAITASQRPWAKGLAAGLSPFELKECLRVLNAIESQLNAS
jgi:DNA-binding MarR family transcriptional regulator